VQLLRPECERLGVLRAILFGSYAKGCADAWSGVDLVLVIVVTPEEFELGRSRGIGVLAAIAEHGIEVHARHLP
jgi:predicted nucleotidyltransferase